MRVQPPLYARGAPSAVETRVGVARARVFKKKHPLSGQGRAEPGRRRAVRGLSGRLADVGPVSRGRPQEPESRGIKGRFKARAEEEGSLGWL